MSKIAMLLTTFGRSEMCRIVLESISKTAFNKKNIGVFIGLSEGDKDIQKYTEMIKQSCKEFGLDISVYIFRDWTLAMCHNVLSEKTMDYDLHFGVGDDTIFRTPGWDETIIKSYKALDNKIHMWSLLDNRDAKGMPAPCISREYIQAMGWRVPPYFMHWYCDTWTTEIAKANNCITHLTDYLLFHDKQSERGIKDEAYYRIRHRGGYERDSYMAESCKHFLEVEKKRLGKIIEDWKLDRKLREE